MTMTPPTVTSTLRLKVKREAYAWLGAAASEVNMVFNFCNETALLAATRTDSKRKWLTGFDLTYLTAGSSSEFKHIKSGTIEATCLNYAKNRRAARRLKLRWRVSTGARRSLGWVPFRGENVRLKGGVIRFCGKTFRVFEVERLRGACWRMGCFAQDAVGDWWLCLQVEAAVDQAPAPKQAVGIDLGLKSIATTSDGQVLEAGRWTHAIARRLAMAQRRGHKRQAKRLHRKAARQRKDALHKFSTGIVRQYQQIIVGDVSSLQLAKTRMAKSVLDSGWGMLKSFLDYKSQQAARSFQVVSERNTTRACSACGALTGPAGRTGLVVRQWCCSACGAEHDRDVNAARNILARISCDPPLAGTSWGPVLAMARATDSREDSQLEGPQR